MGNSCCSGPGEGDNHSVGIFSQPGKVSINVTNGDINEFKAFEKPVKLGIHPAAFGVSGFKVEALGMKLQPGVQALVQKFGLYTWLPVSPGYNVGLPVYKATMIDGFYMGQMENGNREGKGYLHNRSGDLIACSFEQDQPNGRGAIYFSSGDYFEGLITNGETIEGKMTYQDGSHYIGEMNGEGYMHGKGILHDRDGSTRYEGTWTNNLRDGLGNQFKNEVWRNGVRVDALPIEQQIKSPQRHP